VRWRRKRRKSGRARTSFAADRCLDWNHGRGLTVFLATTEDDSTFQGAGGRSKKVDVSFSCSVSLQFSLVMNLWRCKSTKKRALTGHHASKVTGHRSK